MITVLVPTFDEWKRYAFMGNVEVKIKNNPDSRDVNKITKHLPGIPMGGVGRYPLLDLLEKKTKEVRSFYDVRQRTRMLKGYYVIIK